MNTQDPTIRPVRRGNALLDILFPDGLPLVSSQQRALHPCKECGAESADGHFHCEECLKKWEDLEDIETDENR